MKTQPTFPISHHVNDVFWIPARWFLLIHFWSCYSSYWFEIRVFFHRGVLFSRKGRNSVAVCRHRCSYSIRVEYRAKATTRWGIGVWYKCSCINCIFVSLHSKLAYDLKTWYFTCSVYAQTTDPPTPSTVLDKLTTKSLTRWLTLQTPKIKLC